MSKKQPRIPHTCHVHKCKAIIPKILFACTPHWRQLPVQMQREIKNAFVPEQLITGVPSAAWMIAAHRAILWLARKEYPQEYQVLKKRFEHVDRLHSEKKEEKEDGNQTETISDKESAEGSGEVSTLPG